jgi:hypothetical protein
LEKRCKDMENIKSEEQSKLEKNTNNYGKNGKQYAEMV